MFPSTFSFHFIFGRPCLRFPSTSCTIAFIKIFSSGRLKTRSHQLILFSLASLSTSYLNPNMSISSSVFLLSTNFTPHIAHIINLSALLNPILLKLFRGVDSSTAGLQKPTNLTIYNSKTTYAIFMKFKQSKDHLFNFC